MNLRRCKTENTKRFEVLSTVSYSKIITQYSVLYYTGKTKICIVVSDVVLKTGFGLKTIFWGLGLGQSGLGLDLGWP